MTKFFTRATWSLILAFASVGFVRAQQAEKPKAPTPQEIAAKFKDTVDIRFDQPYAGNENPRQMVDVYLPVKRATDKPLPVVVYIHGGGWINGDRKGYVGQATALVATGNYAAVAVGYRMSNEKPFPAQIHDCKAAIRYIRGHAKDWNIDPNKIGATGSSAGGHLSTLVATSGNVKTLDGDIGDFTSLPGNVTCVVNFCGPMDFSLPLFTGAAASNPDPAVNGLLGGSPTEKPDVMKAASPVTYVSKETPPIMTIHGTADGRVDFKHAEAIDAALKQNGITSLLIPVVGAGHGIPQPQELKDRVQAFWDKYLRGVETEISTAPIEAPPAEPKKS
jgi:acetyl esterase/lipase